MGTPHAMPKEHAYAPVKYDVEELSQKDFKNIHSISTALEKDKGNDAGDCDVDDTDCRNKSVELVKKPSEDAQL